jgi:hypothetical protein
VQTIVHDEFERFFGAETAGGRERYAAPARAIWHAVLKSRAK